VRAGVLNSNHLGDADRPHHSLSDAFVLTFWRTQCVEWAAELAGRRWQGRSSAVGGTLSRGIRTATRPLKKKVVVETTILEYLGRWLLESYLMMSARRHERWHRVGGARYFPKSLDETEIEWIVVFNQLVNWDPRFSEAQQHVGCKISLDCVKLSHSQQSGPQDETAGG